MLAARPRATTPTLPPTKWFSCGTGITAKLQVGGAKAAVSVESFTPSHSSAPLKPVQMSDAARALQEVSDEKALVDLFGRKHTYLRVSLTEKCNFRCVYCMPEDGVELTPRAELPTLEERKRLLDIFARLGVKKLRFTGGEPTVSNQLLPLLQHAQTVCAPESGRPAFPSVGITTNGFSLKRQVQRLASAGLTSVNISLDSLEENKFAKLTRRDGKAMLKVLSSMYAALDAGLHTKINCVLMAGTNDDELADFIKLTRDTKIDVRFIEYMPFDGNRWDNTQLVGYRNAMQRLEVEHGILLQPADCIDADIDAQKKENGNQISSRDASGARKGHYNDALDAHDTTKWYRAPGHAGRVGFISTMTDHFCGSCNRLRLTADGKLKVCLFGDEELSLLDCLRSGMTDTQVIAEMAAAVRRKQARLGGEENAIDLANVERQNRPMIMIGG
jgi:molybdenum cofactor biosynthesis enzyme MoaA